ncbi:MAG: hypothetical protein GC150_03305 [Rhizobiales bacterium]|nr:hypothetical protein [Hyphomicrobiales bacterium]
MIETVLLVALGFLTATLIAALIAPAFHARVVRLTTRRIKQSLPVSELEIRADKDRLRARYALQVHQLEREIDTAKLAAARQLIELNRRDAANADLRARTAELEAELEEHQNARRVLEQTIGERLPRLEGRLDEARRLIQARDRTIGELTNELRDLENALDEARTINAPAQLPRAARVGPRRQRRAMTESEAEVRADTDQMRAQYALQVHQLEREIEAARLSTTTQLIELNRREARIAEYERRTEALQAEHHESEGARLLLEQTINERIPQLESRLEEARSLLKARDEAMDELTEKALNLEATLDQIRSLNIQLEDENQRMRAALSNRQDRDRRHLVTSTPDQDGGLRNEVITLRAQARENASLIDRLRRELTGSRGAATAASEVVAKAAVAPPADRAGGLEAEVTPDSVDALRERIETLSAALTTAESELARQAAVAAGGSDAAARRVREQEERLRANDETIARLRAEVAAFEAERSAAEGAEGRESKGALRGKLGALQKRFEFEQARAARLENELAAANDRAARLTAHFMNEMRHLGGRSTRSEPGAPSDDRRIVTPDRLVRRVRVAAGSGRSVQSTTLREAMAGEPAGEPTITAAGEPAGAPRLAERAEESAGVRRRPAPAAEPQATVAPGEAAPTEAVAQGTEPRPERSRFRAKLLERLRSYD